MAKKKASAEEAEKTDVLDTLYDEINQQYGRGVMTSHGELLEEGYVGIPWTPALDIINSGPIREGSWVGVTGHPKSGKSSTILSFCANAQKPEYGSRTVIYLDVEGRVVPERLEAIKGLRTERNRFAYIKSQHGNILSAQQQLTILDNVIRSVPNAVVVIDSISSLCDQREIDNGIGTETRGGGAKLFSQFCRLVNQVVPVQKTIVFGVTHIIKNTSGRGPAEFERVARMWQYQVDYQLRNNKLEHWQSDGRNIGFKANWTCKTSKNGPPGMTVDSYFRYGIGIDSLYEAMSLASAANLIKRSGSWYTLAYLERPEYQHLVGEEQLPKFQGMEQVYKALSSQPELAEPLYQEVSSLSSMLGWAKNEAE